MVKKYWKTNYQSPTVLDWNKKNLEGIMAFLNADIESMDNESFLDLIFDVALYSAGKTGYRIGNVTMPREWLGGKAFMGRVVATIREKKDFFAKFKADLLQTNALSQRSDEWTRGEKDFYTKLQTHLRSRVDRIIAATKKGFKTPLFEIPGILKITVDADLFLKDFDLGEDLKDPLEDEKRRIDLRLANLIWELNLNPERLRKCARCERYFYQATSRNRNYCSAQCAAAVRQMEFQKRKKLAQELKRQVLTTGKADVNKAMEAIKEPSTDTEAVEKEMWRLWWNVFARKIGDLREEKQARDFGVLMHLSGDLKRLEEMNNPAEKRTEVERVQKALAEYINPTRQAGEAGETKADVDQKEKT